MGRFSNRYVAVLLVCAFVLYINPRAGRASDALPEGKPTADEAAAWHADEAGAEASSRFAYAYSDTTEFEFPEEENDTLLRDIAVFVVASAFVAYFIIKVFLEGDTEEPPPDDGGKKLPDAPL